MKALLTILLATVCSFSVEAFPISSKYRRSPVRNSDTRSYYDYVHQNYLGNYNTFSPQYAFYRHHFMRPWFEYRARHFTYSSAPWGHSSYLNYRRERNHRKWEDFKSKATQYRTYLREKKLCFWSVQSNRITKLLTEVLSKNDFRRHTVKDIISSTDQFTKFAHESTGSWYGYKGLGKHDVTIDFIISPTSGCDWRMKCDCKPQKPETMKMCKATGTFEYGSTKFLNYRLECEEEKETKEPKTTTVTTTEIPSTTQKKTTPTVPATTTSTTTTAPDTTTTTTNTPADLKSGDYENADERYSGDAVENPLDEESRDSEDDIYADTVKLSTPNYHEEADLKIDALEEESLFIPTKAIMTNTNKAEVESGDFESGDGGSASGYSGDAIRENPLDEESGDFEDSIFTSTEATTITSRPTTAATTTTSATQPTTAALITPKNEEYESGDDGLSSGSGYSGDAYGENPLDEEDGDSDEEFESDIEKLPARIFKEGPDMKVDVVMHATKISTKTTATSSNTATNTKLKGGYQHNGSKITGHANIQQSRGSKTHSDMKEIKKAEDEFDTDKPAPKVTQKIFKKKPAALNEDFLIFQYFN